MKRGGHKIKSIRSILISASLVISTIAFAIVVNLFAFNSDNTAMAISKQECENSGYDTTWEGTKCYQWVTDSSVNPGLACDSKTGHQTRGGVCKKRIEVQNKADMEANNEAASSSSGTTDDSADPDSSTDLDDTSSSSDEGSCEENVGVFGWLICPGQDLVTKIVDQFLQWIDGSMQYTILASTDTTADTANSASIKEIWQKFANIANIIFAVAFLIMIYSMATSTGLSNYHVKKILPKVIVMAIIVNISFYICAAALDISNIIGYNIKEFIWSVGSTSVDLNPLSAFTTAIGVAVTAAIALFFGGTILVAFAIILLAIGFRHVVLTVLVIISPVALSLYMLPNTEKWAKKWTSTFISLLIVYPAFSAVWGASRLLSNTFLALGASSQVGGIPYAIMPTICSIAPAIAIIPLFKMSSGLMGYVAGRAMGSGIARGAQGKINMAGRSVAKNNALTRLGARGINAGMGALAGQTKATGIIGSKARQAQAWARAHGNVKGSRVQATAAMEKAAQDKADALVAGMTSAQALDAFSNNGQYKDANGKDINLGNDKFIHKALASKLNLSSPEEQEKVLMQQANMAKDLISKGKVYEAQERMTNLSSAMSAAGHSTAASVASSFASGKVPGYDGVSLKDADDTMLQSSIQAKALSHFSDMSPEQLAKEASAKNLQYLEDSALALNQSGQLANMDNDTQTKVRDLKNNMANNSRKVRIDTDLYNKLSPDVQKKIHQYGLNNTGALQVN